ncbi:hypothetical protein F5146DRAFT_530182 [Armillaria mellea]|nr:hypothetical protein F5146DRAFT_530182 [Armillaria mellea]
MSCHVCITAVEPRSMSARRVAFSLQWSYRWGFKRARLPKIGFVPVDDEGAFGFLDPSLVLRACRLAFVFSSGRTRTLLDFPPSAARHPGEDEDWGNYHVMIFVDRDMCMCYLGGGIGHGADPNLKDNDSRRAVETTDNKGNDERDDEASVGEETEEDDEYGPGSEDQCSEDSGDSEGFSEDGADSVHVESGYFDPRKNFFPNLLMCGSPATCQSSLRQDAAPDYWCIVAPSRSFSCQPWYTVPTIHDSSTGPVVTRALTASVPVGN